MHNKKKKEGVTYSSLKIFEVSSCFTGVLLRAILRLFVALFPPGGVAVEFCKQINSQFPRSWPAAGNRLPVAVGPALCYTFTAAFERRWALGPLFFTAVGRVFDSTGCH
jgi:hypothetical protein